MQIMQSWSQEFCGIRSRDQYRLTRFLVASKGRLELDLPVVVVPSLDTKAPHMRYIRHL